MSKKELKIKPVDQEVTKEDLKKVNGGDGAEWQNCGDCPKDDGWIQTF